MAVDKLVDSTQLDADLTSVANAIRTKGGTSGSLAFPGGFVSAVQAIPTGVTPTGTKQISITQNGTTTEDVTNYANAEITVNVSGGGGTPYYEPWNNSSFFERIGIQSNSGVEQIGTTGVYYATSNTRVSTRPIIDASPYGDEWYFIPLASGIRFFVRLFDENLTEQLFSGGWVSAPTKYDFSGYNYKYIAWSISYASGAGVPLSDYEKVMALTRQAPSGSSATEYTAEEVVDIIVSWSRPSAAALNMLNGLLFANGEETE